MSILIKSRQASQMSFHEKANFTFTITLMMNRTLRSTMAINKHSEQQQPAHYHERRLIHAYIHRRTIAEYLVAAAVVLGDLSTSSQSTIFSHGFQHTLPSSQQPFSSFCVNSRRTRGSSPFLSSYNSVVASSSTPVASHHHHRRQVSSPLHLSSTSSVSEQEEVEKQQSSSSSDGEISATTTTTRDAAFPISRSYQRQIRAMMEATTTTTIQQQPPQQLETDRDEMYNVDVVSSSASSSSTTITSNDVDVVVSPEEYQRGLFTIGFCTLVFASMSPAMHFCLSSDQTSTTIAPPPVLLLNAAVSIVAFIGLLLTGPFLEKFIPKPSTLLVIQEGEQQQLQQTEPSSSSSKATIIELSSQTMISSTLTSSSSSSSFTSFSSRINKAQHNNNGNSFTSLTTVTNRAGLELGLWKFLGTTTNLFGLSLTSSDHGAFLIQLTTLIVPTVQGLMGIPIPKRIQGSIVLALIGVVLFTQDFSSLAAASSVAAATDMDAAAALLLSTTREHQLTGDALCVLAAVFYATYDLRLYEWGKRVAPRELITTKIGAQAFFSLALFLLGGSGGNAWSDSISFLQNVMDNYSNGSFLDQQTLLLMVLVLWSGFMVNAIVPFLQVGGQQAIGPTRAQTLYASQPLWAAIMSFFFLGETVGIQGLVGGGAFLAALFLAATSSSSSSIAQASPEESSSVSTNTETTTTTISETLESAIVAEQQTRQLKNAVPSQF